MNKSELKQLIRESITDQLSKLKEKSTSSKQHQANDLCKILQTQVDALNSIISHSEKVFNETQYKDLNTHKATLETMREAKIQKIAEIKSKYGIQDKKKVVKKAALKKKIAPKKVLETKKVPEKKK